MTPRTEWTDARLNDLVERLDRNMERLDQGLRDLRGEMLELRREMSELRRDGVLATAALVAAIVGTGVLT
jgi:phage shock protein A